MSDDIWRQDDTNATGSSRRQPGRYESEMDEFAPDEFGGPLFGDDSGGVSAPTADASASTGDDTSSLSLRDDTGSMPHWTEPPTGDLPPIGSTSDEGDDDGLDVWSTFTTDSPVWKEGDRVDEPSGVVARRDRAQPADPTGELSWEDDPSGGTAGATGEQVTTAPEVDDEDGVEAAATAATGTVQIGEDAVDDAREPARITIGTDPSGMPRRPEPARRGAAPQRPPSARPQPGGSDKRNLPVAVLAGLILAGSFLALTLWRPLGSLVFVTIVLALAGVEYFGKVSEKGYRPAVAPGLAAIVAAPLTAYWVGEAGLPLVIVLAFMAGALSFIGARGIESGPMPNMAITSLGITWIGIMGSYAALMIDWSNFGGGTPWGTDTLVLTAIGIVANDVGAYFVGSAFGRTPLRAWISPGKSVEGFLGGTIL
ncbi:MAG: phosphatidate cytidylyltransferase, partial [Actinomycetota bacterium]